MTPDAILATLRQAPFFRGMNPAHLELIARHTREVSFAKGHFLLVTGQPARHFYLLTAGKVAIELASGDGSSDAGPVTIQSIRQDELVGWSWLLPPYRWRFDALAVEATVALEMDGVALRGLCEHDPSFGFDMSQRVALMVAERLAATRRHLLKVYG